MSHCKIHGEIFVEYGGNTGAPVDGYCYQCHIDELKTALQQIATNWRVPVDDWATQIARKALRENTE